MKRTFRFEKVDYNKQVCFIKLESDDCNIDSLEGRIALSKMFKHMSEDLSLVGYKDLIPENIQITHNNSRWFIVARYIDYNVTTE